MHVSKIIWQPLYLSCYHVTASLCWKLDISASLVTSPFAAEGGFNGQFARPHPLGVDLSPITRHI